jgi:hypothetical protein
MTSMLRLTTIGALAAIGLMAPAKADIVQFIGKWQNVNSQDRGAIKAEITQQGGAVTVHIFGQCQPTPCDWGQAPATLYADDVQAPLPQRTQVIRAEYNQGFARRQVIIRPSGNQLRIDVLTQFTDNSGRSNYFDSDLFNREPETEDCIGFNPATAQAALVQGRWKLVDGNMWMLDFGNSQDEAKKAEAIVKFYKLNRQCFVGRPDPSFTYWLVGQQSAVGPMPGEDCIAFNTANVQAVLSGGVWKMMDGNHAMFVFPSQAEAQKAVDIVKHYGFNQTCFVGRPGPSMSYQRK